MQNLLEELKDVLIQEPKYLVDGQLFKNKIVEDALKLEPSLLRLVAKNDNIKRHFFVDVDGMAVFDKVKFQDFVNNKNFLPDSYTAFKNKIGLNDGKTYLKNTNDVVLSWAYKDCILEGGMTKEEVKGSVPEIFYNTTLAPDEITRLLDPKVFSNFQLWDEEAVKSGKAKKPSDITENDNLLIKGNNLLALHSLKKRYAGKVKLIYIDPPYNTGNDGFRYNDSFNHSTWLTFIRNRLEIAKKLLKEDGLIFIQTDDTEHCYLKVLMDEVFERDNFISCIAYERSGVSGLGQGGSYLTNTHEFILMYAKNKSLSKTYDVFDKEELDYEVMKRYNKILLSEGDKESCDGFIAPSTKEEVKIFKHSNEKIASISLKDFDNRKSEIISQYRDNFEKIFRNTSVQVENEFQNKILSICKDGLYSAQYLVSRGKQKGRVITSYYLNGQVFAWLKDTASKDKSGVYKENKISQFWTHKSIPKADLANEGGINLKRGKKPENLIKRIIELSTAEGDIVLDFFAGSGSTPAVAHKMGRRWIAVEQMDYIKDLPEQRLKNVVAGDSTGVSKAVNWQGGGSFVYCELKEWNEDFLQKARKAKNSNELLKVYEEMKEQAFFRYDFDSKKFDNKAFSELEFVDQQKALIDMLDKNHLYVNYSEIEDSRYNLSDEEKELSAKFYGDK